MTLYCNVPDGGLRGGVQEERGFARCPRPTCGGTTNFRSAALDKHFNAHVHNTVCMCEYFLHMLHTIHKYIYIYIYIYI